MHSASCPPRTTPGVFVFGTPVILGQLGEPVNLGSSSETVSAVSVSLKVNGWKNVLTNSSQNVKIPFPHPEEEIYALSIDFSIHETVSDRIVSSMENVVVGCFLSFRPMMDMVRRWVSTKWCLKGSVEICAMASGHFLFNFTASKYLISVLSSGPWVYGKHSLALCLWKLGFDPVVDLNKSTSMWICLLGLPLEYWDESILKCIGDSLGHLITSDSITRSKSRLVFARFCVNIEVHKSFPTSVKLNSKFGSWTQQVCYENVVVYYQKCDKPSHLISNCKSSLKHVPNPSEFVIDYHYPFQEGILKIVDSLVKFGSPKSIDSPLNSDTLKYVEDVSFGDSVLVPIAPTLSGGLDLPIVWVHGVLNGALSPSLGGFLVVRLTP